MREIDLEYNTERVPLIIPEYGRAVHRMVEHCMAIADREERNKCAKSIITIMGNLVPQYRDVEDYRHKLWDHLFIMSGFQLDVESPYPLPSPQQLIEKPKRVEYPGGDIKYGHYGRVTQQLIDKALSLENADHAKKMGIQLFHLMKRSYKSWNRDYVEDEVVLKHLKELSNGGIILKPEEVVSNEREHNHNNSNKKRKWVNKKGGPSNNNHKRRPN